MPGSSFALAPCSATPGDGGGPPTGSGALWFAAVPPAGYLLCDGSAVSRATYSALFAVIGTTWGVGDGSTTFNLPNFKGRVPMGLDVAQTEFDTLAETGGAKTVTLDVSMMPAHTHVQDAHTHVQNSHNHTQDAHTHIQTGHTHTIPVGATDDTAAPFDRADAGTNTSGANATTATGSTVAVNQNATATNQAATATNQNATAVNQSTGGGAAHPNLPPYLVVNFIIKT